MLGLDDLYGLFTRLRAAHSPDGSAMTDLALVYDGGLVTRIAELDAVSESAVPNLIAQGIDQYARFSAEARPDVEFAAVRPNIASSRKRAGERAEVVKGWWRNSGMALVDYQRFRFYYGYGFMPAVIRPDVGRGAPRWQALNPIAVLPGPREVPYSPEVPYAFVVTSMSAQAVKERWGLDFGRDCRPEAMVEVVEYQDAEQVSWFCLGPSGKVSPSWPSGRPGGWSWGVDTGWNYGSEIRDRRITRLGDAAGGNWLAMLSTTPNLAGRCMVSCPGVISLSKVSGFITGILSKHHLQARLMALTVKGVAKGILPDEWLQLEAGTGQAGVIREADGLRGVRGIIEGRIEVPQISPTYQTFPLLDRLEAYQRSESGVVASLGGESGANIRTRARGEALDSNVIDPRVREAHEIMQWSLEQVEVPAAVAWAKAHGGSRPRTIFVGTRGGVAKEYVASDLFENDHAAVAYPLAGTNVNGATIVGGQLVGTGLAALDTIRRLHPWIENADDEAVKIRVEAAEQVLLANLQMLVESSPDDAAFVTRRLREGALPETVWEEAQRRAQERQATQDPAGEPLGPAVPGSPEAQPGLGEPGVADVPPVVEEPSPSVGNVARLFSASRIPSMTVPAERAV